MKKYLSFLLICFFYISSFAQEMTLEHYRATLDKNKIKNITSSNENLKSSTELKASRTESSLEFMLGENKRAVALTAGPMNYKENGRWELTHNEFIPFSNKNNYLFSSPFNNVKLYVGNAENSVLMQTKELNEFKFGLDRTVKTLNNNILVQKSVASLNAQFNLTFHNGEPSLLYKDIFNGMDSRYLRLSDGFKQEYVINNPSFYGTNFTDLVFSEKIVLPEGFIIEKQLNGERESLIFIASDRSQVINLSPILIYDNTYAKTYGRYEVKDLGRNTYEISYIVSSAWLLDVSRVYPIVVDPTATVSTTNSTWWTGTVDEDGGSLNPDYCTAGDILVGFEDGTTGNDMYHSTAKFDVGIIPDNACVYNTNLYLYQQSFVNGRNDDNDLKFTIGTSTADPVTASCQAMYNAIQAGTKFESWDAWGSTWAGPAGSIGNNDYNETSNGWKTFLNYGNNTSAQNYDTYVQNSLASNSLIFGFDFYSEGHSDIGFDFGCFCTHDNNEWINFAGYGSGNRPYVVVSYDLPITVSTQPLGAVKCAGQSVSFSTVAIGGGVYNYQWQFDGTGSFVNISGANSSTYSIASIASSNAGNYRCVISNFCGSVTTSNALLTVNTASTAPTTVTGNTTICNGLTTTLTVSGGSLGTGASYQWYSSSCGGTSVGSGNSITVSPSITTTYYVRAEGLCATTSCINKTVTVQTQSTAPGSVSASLSTICVGNSTTLSVNGGSLGTGATWNWYSGTCGGTLVGTGSSITVSPTTSTTYFVRAEGPCNTTTCASTSIVVNNLSVAPTGITSTGDTVCFGGSTILSVAGGSLGTGAIWKWYTNSCGGVSVGSGNSISVSPTSNTIYYVRAEGTCNTTVCAQRSITAAQNPVQPICPDVLQCESFPVTLTATGNGGTIKWYMTNISTPELSIGNSLSLGMFGAGTYYRYVTETNAFGCESTRNEVEIVIKPIPSDAPAAADATICPGASASLLATNPGGAIIPATNFNWYNSPALTTVVYTGAIYNTPNLITPPATYTFYVAGVLDGCIGDTSSVVVDFYQAAKPIASNDTSVCNGDMVSLFASAAGSVEIRWYANGDLSGYIQSGASFTTPSLNSNTTYYVTAVYPNGCQSQAEPVVISINPLALSPVLTDEEYCQGDDVVLNANNINGIITWYSDAALTTAVGTGSPLNLGVLPADTLTFFAQVNNGTCVSLVIANTVEIEALPVAPTLTAPTICAGEQATITVSSPFNVSWYADVAMTNLLFVGSTFTTPTLNVSTTYYVSNTNVNGCQSLSSSVLVTVNPKPAAPVVADEFVCANESATLIATGGSGTFIWFSDAALANQLFVGATFVTPNLTTNTSYYVVLDNGLCRSVAKTVLVSINPAAISPITTDEQYCETEDLILNASNVNGTITWYSDAALTNVVGTGTPLNLGSLFTAGTYNFFAQVDNGTCVSLVVANSVEIIALPPAPILTAPTICAGEQAVINVTNALNVNWYSDAAMTNLLFVGATFTTPILNANTTYYVSNSNAGGCQSLSVSVLVTVNPKPAAPTAANVVICKNQSATLIASGGAGIFTWYSDAALANQLFVGATFVTPNLNANTSYYVVLNNGLCQSLAKQVNVTVNLDIVIVIDSITDVLCNGSNTGAIYTSVSGGNGIYNYAWTGGSTSQDLVNAAAGNYVLTVTDGLGCTASNNASISSPDELTAAIDNIQNVSCNGFSDGSVEVTISGGTSAYTYSWSDGSTLVSTSKNLYGIGAGSYTLTITDANGCVQSLVANVTENGALTASINSTNVLCYGGSGTASVVATGGNGTYTYLWSNFANTASVSGLDMGAVSVIVYDGIGCSVHVYDTIRGPIAPLTITTLGTKDVTCFNGNDGFINTSVSGGTAPYVLFWSPTGETTSNIANLSAGQYILTVRDANLCVITKTFEINNALEIVSTMSVTNPACYGLETGMIVVGNSGGTAPYSYAWNTTPAQTGVIAINLPGDTSYTVTITDINGCTGQNTASVVYPAEMLVTTIPTNVSCISSANGSVTVDVQNGNAPLQYELNGFLQSNNVFDNLNGGNYVVFVKDNNNCVASASFNISTVSGLQAVLEGAGNDLNFVTENLYIVRGEEVSLNVSLLNDNGNPILGYNWNPNYIDSTSLLSNPSFYPNDNLMVIVEVLEDINGNVCSVFDTLRIDVSQEMKAFVPTAFSPNNNGQNNFFELNVLGSQNLDVKIFNRWGQLIFANANQGNGPNNINDVSLTDGTNPRGAWDGKYNGEDVPTGAYAYVVEVTYFDGHKEVLSGSVTIIR